MIRYYCNKCGKEIASGDMVRMDVRCHALLGSERVYLDMHRACAETFFDPADLEKARARKAAKNLAAQKD